MSAPSLLFSFLLASLYGVLFYFILGHGWLQLGIYWLAALVGFALGQLLSAIMPFSLLAIGSVRVIEASVVCVLVLFLTRMLLGFRRK